MGYKIRNDFVFLDSVVKFPFKVNSEIITGVWGGQHMILNGHAIGKHFKEF
jgi:hypothetical protein